MYFKSQVELDTIYRTMEGRNVDTVEEGIQVNAYKYPLMFSYKQTIVSCQHVRGQFKRLSCSTGGKSAASFQKLSLGEILSV